MNCEDIRELLPAYVLGALDADDLATVEEHLRLGHEHDDELVELRATVFALDRFADEAALMSSAAPASAPKRADSIRFARIRSLTTWQVALAAAVLIAVFGLGWLAAGLTQEKSGQVQFLLQGSSGEVMTVSSETSSNLVTVTMTGFQQLASDHAYQIWAIRNGKWLRIGTCNTNYEGGWRGEFPFSLHDGEQIALTVEPAAGSSSPTSDPLLISKS
jgi:anti-sigma-K factor RskA